MLKYSFSVLFLLVLGLVVLGEIDKNYKDSLPKIALPLKAKDTFGSIPVIEHLDDGRLADLENEFEKKLKKVEEKYKRLERKYDDGDNKGFIKNRDREIAVMEQRNSKNEQRAIFTSAVVWFGDERSFW